METVVFADWRLYEDLDKIKMDSGIEGHSSYLYHETSLDSSYILFNYAILCQHPPPTCPTYHLSNQV